MNDHQSALDVVATTGAAVATKVTLFGAGLAAAAGWWTSLPSGVIAGMVIGLLGLLVNIVFRALADHRDRKYRAMEADLLRLRHEAYMRRQEREAHNTEPGAV